MWSQKTIEKGVKSACLVPMKGEKMEIVNGTARWIQLVSYSLKSPSPCLGASLSSEESCVGASVRTRVSVSDSCESRENSSSAIFKQFVIDLTFRLLLLLLLFHIT